MPLFRLYLIRHGHPSAGFAEATDPGLNEIGITQAQAVAQELSALGPLPVLTSPLKRARETARPFETIWKVDATVDVRIAEVPSPSQNLEERTAWIHRALRGRWSDLSTEYQAWREQVVQCLVTQKTSTVMTTHFVAINAAVGAATGDDRLMCFEPDHCSCTVLEVENEILRVVALGRQRATVIR
ncbi:MAG: histidine phosphatase family protein [Deltaproteobacteria bacterium]|nr:histidine phosphatase family protein [Deltaproteobacteria bacterium]